MGLYNCSLTSSLEQQWNYHIHHTRYSAGHAPEWTWKKTLGRIIHKVSTTAVYMGKLWIIFHCFGTEWLHLSNYMNFVFTLRHNTIKTFFKTVKHFKSLKLGNIMYWNIYQNLTKWNTRKQLHCIINRVRLNFAL